MIIATTESIEGTEIEEYIGIVAGEAIMGANVVKDFMAGITDLIGGRSSKYEEEIREGRKEALKDLESRAKSLGVDAVVGVRADYEEMGEGMLWISVTGTAVKLR